MATTGGSANANGVLYQILGTLGHAVNVTIQPKSPTNNDDDVQIVIEPEGGGGDIQIVKSDRLVVEQWKSRGTDRAWSFSEVLDGVLPDLLKATPLDADEYRFVTEGRRGRWDKAYELFQKLGPVPQGSRPSDALDNETRLEILDGKEQTERELFLDVVKRVREKLKDNQTSEAELERRVWLLLSRFTMSQPYPASELRDNINKKLLESVTYIEDVDAKRLQLCGRILELASQGGVRIRAEELLCEAGLSPKTFLAPHKISESLRQRLEGRLDRMGFDPDLDVRPNVVLHEASPIIMFNGESGSGKTWRLASLAQSISQGGGLAVWVGSTRGQRSACDIASEELWCQGFDQDFAISLEAISRRRKLVVPNTTLPWAWVFVDGVHSIDEAKQLVDQAWEDLGIRLVMSTSPDVAEALKRENGDRIQSIAVSDFLPAEVRDYLKRNGRDWASTPHDVRELIRTPILAKLYVDLSEQHGWTPRYEYELMREYWRRIRLQNDYSSLDYAGLRALVHAVLEAPPAFDWSPERVHAAGISEDMLVRLKKSGWLREIGDGVVECCHDRLLCWAVAEAICRRVLDNKMSLSQVGDLLRSIVKTSDAWFRRLGYVAMDTLWLMADPSNPTEIRNNCWQLIASMESNGGFGFEDREHYEKLIPTLGDRIIEPIVDRIRNATVADHNPLPRLAAKAITLAGGSHVEAIERVRDTCLCSDDQYIQELGLRLIADYPAATQLNRIWELLLPQTMLRGEEWAKNHQRYKATFRALAVSLQRQPEWIETQLDSGLKDSGLVAIITDAFSQVSSSIAESVWKRCKERLFQIVETSNCHVLPDCILRFRDQDEMDRLQEWAKSENSTLAVRSFMAISFFNPELSAKQLPYLKQHHLRPYTSTIRGALLAFATEATCKSMRQMIGESDNHAALVLDLARASDRLDRATIKAVIELVGEILKGCSTMDDPSSDPLLSMALSTLEDMRGAIPFEVMREQANTTFEVNLEMVAMAIFRKRNEHVDHDLEAAISSLLKIGGAGLTRVVNALLASKNTGALYKGCKLARISPDDITREHVAALAGVGHNQNELPVDSEIIPHEAINTLAAIGADGALIRAVLKRGRHISPHVAECREGFPPMSDEAIAPALAVLDDPVHEQFPHAVLALGFTGREEFRPRLTEWLQNADPESEVSLAAMLSLEDLGGLAPDLYDRVVEQYRSGHHKYSALKLMATADDQDVAQLFLTALPANEPYDDMDQRVITMLANRQSTRKLVGAQVRQILKTKKYHGTFWLVAETNLLDPTQPQDAERLWKMASQPTQAFRVTGKKAGAIERLASTDPDSAFELARRSLIEDSLDQDKMPRILMMLSGEKALPILFDHAIETLTSNVCATIAIAIRDHGSTPTIHALIRSKFESDDPWVRRVAAFMCGFIGPAFCQSELKALVLNDGDVDVCAAATRAVRRQQREQEAQQLIDRLIDADSISTWAIADDIINLVDLDVLVAKSDPLGFLKAMWAKQFVIRDDVFSKIDDRRKKSSNDPSLNRRWDE